jgi:hypothetical protein
MQIKQASMTLVKMYMKRLTMELESNRNSDRESSQDSLLLQGVHFAYRAHQVFFLATFKGCIMYMKNVEIVQKRVNKTDRNLKP